MPVYVRLRDRQKWMWKTVSAKKHVQLVKIMMSMLQLILRLTLKWDSNFTIDIPTKVFYQTPSLYVDVTTLFEVYNNHLLNCLLAKYYLFLSPNINDWKVMHSSA